MMTADFLEMYVTPLPPGLLRLNSHIFLEKLESFKAVVAQGVTRAIA